MSRTRNWAVIGYPESLKIGWLDILAEKGVQALVSPLHDKDVYSKDVERNGVVVNHKGETKKEHYHIIFIFDSVKSEDQVYKLVCEISKPLQAVHPIAILNLRSSVRYLIHKDNPEKAQYNVEDVINIGGIDIDKYLANEKEKEDDLNNKFSQILDIIKGEDLDSFSNLATFLMTFDLDLFSVFRKNAYFFSMIMKERYWAKRVN